MGERQAAHRPDHVDTKVAIDGTDPANDPTGWYGFDMNPKLVNPERGFVYSATTLPTQRQRSLPRPLLCWEHPGDRHF